MKQEGNYIYFVKLKVKSWGWSSKRTFSLTFSIHSSTGEWTRAQCCLAKQRGLKEHTEERTPLAPHLPCLNAFKYAGMRISVLLSYRSKVPMKRPAISSYFMKPEGLIYLDSGGWTRHGWSVGDCDSVCTPGWLYCESPDPLSSGSRWLRALVPNLHTPWWSETPS